MLNELGFTWTNFCQENWSCFEVAIHYLSMTGSDQDFILNLYSCSIHCDNIQLKYKCQKLNKSVPKQ